MNENHKSYEMRGKGYEKRTCDESRSGQASQFVGLGLELLRDQQLDIFYTSQLHQHSHHEAIPLGCGWALEVEGVTEDGAEEHTSGTAARTSAKSEEVVRNDAAHRAPRTNVDVDRHIGNNGSVLECMMINDADNASDL